LKSSVREQKRQGGWGRELTRSDLRDSVIVLSLFEFAVSREWIGNSELDRLRFFALCRACAIKGKNPGAYLTDSLRKQRFNLIRIEDEDAARQAIKRLVHEEPDARGAALPYDAESELVAQAEARKQDFRERLAARRARPP
jgi:hypothetical protein